MLNKKRLEEIAYGSVRQSEDEGRKMARYILELQKQEPLCYLRKDAYGGYVECGQFRESGFPIYAGPVPQQSPINEQEAFELWFASDYSPDKSLATSDEAEAFFKALFWHVWQARARLKDTADAN